MTAIKACVSMIMNTPVKQVGEGNTHFKSKIRVCKLADKYYKDASIWYEYPFNPVATDTGIMKYKGDIVAFLGQHDWIDRVIDIEIDGKKGHGTKIRNWRNSIRDEALQKGIKLNLLYGGKTHIVLIPVHVIRMSAYLHNVDDSDIIAELERK